MGAKQRQLCRYVTTHPARTEEIIGFYRRQSRGAYPFASMIGSFLAFMYRDTGISGIPYQSTNYPVQAEHEFSKTHMTSEEMIAFGRLLAERFGITHLMAEK